MRRTSPIIRTTVAACRQGGFTLLELLLAVTLGGLVLTAVYSTYGTALDANRRIARVATDTQAWRFFTERLRTDLKNLVVEEQALKGDRDTMTLQLAPHNSRPEKVHYKRHKSTDGGQIRRHVSRSEKGQEGEDGQEGEEEETATLVFDGVNRLAFRYLNDGTWRDEAGEHLPRAVECTVEAAGRKKTIVIGLEVEDVDGAQVDEMLEDVKDSTN